MRINYTIGRPDPHNDEHSRQSPQTHCIPTTYLFLPFSALGASISGSSAIVELFFPCSGPVQSYRHFWTNDASGRVAKSAGGPRDFWNSSSCLGPWSLFGAMTLTLILCLGSGYRFCPNYSKRIARAKLNPARFIACFHAASHLMILYIHFDQHHELRID
jgi:hypothetical protein